MGGFSKFFFFFYYCSLSSLRGSEERAAEAPRQPAASSPTFPVWGARAPRCGVIPPASPWRLPGRPPWCGGAAPARRPGGEQRAGRARRAGGARRAGRGGGGAARGLRGAPSAAEPFVRRRHVVPAPRARAGGGHSPRSALRGLRAHPGHFSLPSPGRFCPPARLAAAAWAVQ